MKQREHKGALAGEVQTVIARTANSLCIDGAPKFTRGPGSSDFPKAP